MACLLPGRVSDASANQIDFRLGCLLLQAGMVSHDQLNSAQKQAASEKIRLGDQLIKSGLLTEKVLHSVAIADDLIRKDHLDKDIACRALKLAQERGLTFQEMLSRLLEKRRSELSSNMLAELLSRAGLFPDAKIEQRLRQSLATRLPLGRSLVLQNELPEPLLAAALELLLQVRRNEITMDDAVKALKEGEYDIPSKTGMSILCLHDSVHDGRRVRVDLLLALAGLIARNDLLYSLEVHLTDGTPLERVLSDLGFVSPFIIDAASELRELVVNQVLKLSQAAACLQHVAQRKCCVEAALNTLGIRSTEENEEKYPELEVTAAHWQAVSPGIPGKLHSFDVMRKTYYEIAGKYIERKMFAQAEAVLRHVLEMTHAEKGKQDVLYSDDLSRFATVLCMEKRFREALPFMEEAVNILDFRRSFSDDRAKLASRINMLADINIELGRHDEAEKLLCRALAIRELCLQPDDPDLAYTLNDYGLLLRKTDRLVEAEKLSVQYRSISRVDIPVPQFAFDEKGAH